ncbi:MAG: Crp/Fnr family transcriptional regulator [Anaerolineae bacterium]|nr:Crp/Fnr family transcriptional regulator [Thermoflexales bacterium]MDW8409003.1 Crp/Fnr family transcriptional regulator [Anaerolineae bacterium]
MIRPEHFDRLCEALPFLRPILHDPASPPAQDFARGATLQRVPAGATVFVEGDECNAIAILLSGQVRVHKLSETGREITLYRFEGGESCILTANCILSRHQFPAIATVESDAEAIFIPAPIFRDWVNRYAAWRDYVFDLLARRLALLMAVVNEVAFRRMDARVADFLIGRHTPAQAVLRLTHQQIAGELGTSREVVSRILEDFAASGWIETGRGTITVRNAAALAAKARG